MYFFRQVRDWLMKNIPREYRSSQKNRLYNYAANLFVGYNRKYKHIDYFFVD